MSATIVKIKLHNFKRFVDYTIEPNSRINILVGDNEAGKSTVLEAIDLVISGSIHKVETLGLDKLLNVDAVSSFLQGERTVGNLPVLYVELYLSGELDFTMKGKNNTEGSNCFGIRLICKPNDDYLSEISEAIKNAGDCFPFEYYSVRFSTFADEGYSGYNRKINSVLIDNSNMNSEYATNDFVRKIYYQQTRDNIKERSKHKSLYRQLRTDFSTEGLRDFNENLDASLESYMFGLKTNMDLEDNLMIFEDNVALDCKGMGKQVFVKTDFAIERTKENVDVVLIEEPENHLSPTNLRKLINHVLKSRAGQLFVTTHSGAISTGLELQNVLIMHSDEVLRPVMLKDLATETSKYFFKAPPASIIEFALSKKCILVEGPSEYMLMGRFYKCITGNDPEEDDVHIITVRGLSFKRYLEIARLTNCKVAVITDNDHDYRNNCEKKYKSFIDMPSIGVFFEKDDENYTFEVALYRVNSLLMDQLFDGDALDYMLGNKTEAAFRLLDGTEQIVVPEYIKSAIKWING